MWYAVVMVVDMKFFYTFNMSDTFKSRVLMVNDTLDGKDNLEEKTREVADK